MSDEGKRMSCEALDKIRLFWRTMSNPSIVKDLVDHVDDATAEIARLKRKMCEGCVYDPEYGIEVCEHVINARGEAARLRGQLAAEREAKQKRDNYLREVYESWQAGEIDARLALGIIFTEQREPTPEDIAWATGEKE